MRLAELLIGMDLGGTRIKAGLVEPGGRLLKTLVRPTPLGTEAADLEREVVDLAGALASEVPGELAAIGMAVAGFVQETGEIVQTPNLPALSSCRFLPALRARFGDRPSYAVDLDAIAAAVAEHRHGAARGIRRLLMLVLGTGVGGAFLLDGQPLRVTLNCIGDPGHVIVKENGRRCSAGGRGCLEAEISAAAVSDKARRAMARSGHAPDGEITGAEVFAAYKAGAPWAKEVWNDVGACLGRGLASLAAIFAPQMVVLAGGLAQAMEAFIVSCRRELAECGDDLYVRDLEIRGGAFNEFAGVVGSATMAYEAGQALCTGEAPSCRSSSPPR